MTAPIEEVVDDLTAAPDDKDLVLAFKRGEDGSYQAIHDRYAARVRGICRRMLDRPHDAEEASQEALMRVFTALPNFNGRYQLGAWMSRIATNVCLDHIRSSTRKPADSTDLATLSELSSDSGDGPEDIFFAADERERVRAVLAQLAPMHRAALALREFEGMAYSDIAVALGMTEPQVKALIHRARKAFKKQWAPGLAAFLPWRIFARIGKFSSHYDTPSQVADAAASSMHIATQCSAALQQCGHFVTDRMATAVTALVVGTAAVGVAVAPPQDPQLKVPVIERTESQDPLPLRHRDGKTEVKKKRVRSRVAAVPEHDESESELQPEPGSSPGPEEPSPAESGPPSDEKTEEKPPTNPAPPPLYTYFGWERGQPIPKAQATSHSGKADCATRRLTHRVTSLISDGAFSFTAVFDFEAWSATARLQFSVTKDGREVRYSSWGPEPIAQWTQDGSTGTLEITGEYGALHGYNPDEAKLPRSGTFHATLTLDCAAQTVVTERAVFTAQ